jgi:hypothetical protein
MSWLAAEVLSRGLSAKLSPFQWTLAMSMEILAWAGKEAISLSRRLSVAQESGCCASPALNTWQAQRSPG